MFDRKHLKKNARKLVKRHYILLTVLCAVSIFFGTEFTNAVSNSQIAYDSLSGQEPVINAEGTTSDHVTVEQLLDGYIDDILSTGREKSAARLRELKASSGEKSVLGRQKGVLAALMNTINSGQFTVTLSLALHSLVHSKTVTAVLMILLSTMLSVMVWIFIRNMYRAILRRAVMELRTYKQLPVSHLFFFKSVHRWNRPALSLLLAWVYEWLWWLTVVGGAVKHYSYFLVPFIVAENPDIRPRDAVKLSCRMMNGHKWECFKLDLSFLGWKLLGIFTLGISEIFWTVPYQMAVYSEYYALLRMEAKEKELEGANMLNDDCLFASAGEDTLRMHYKDIIRRKDLIEEEIVTLSPTQRFFAHNFGLWTGTLAEKKIFARQEGLRQQMQLGLTELDGKAYPQRLNPLWCKKSAELTGKISYLSPISVWSLIFVFFSFAMVGWIWEVSLHIVTDGVFVNRGALHGPWLPIYGAGVALIAVLLYRFRRSPAIEAASIVVLCGVVEYFTHLIMEKTLGMHWWDYTGYYLNLNGRICAEGLAVFALGGMAAVYLLLPIIDGAVSRINPPVLISVCLGLLVCLFIDVVYSSAHPNTGKGITDYGNHKQEVQTMVSCSDVSTTDIISPRE